MSKETITSIAIERICPFCGATSTLHVDSKNWIDYREKKLYVQNAFPHLSAGEREIILTGICLQCQSHVFEGNHDNSSR